jgi:hypothetical protein
MAKAIHGDLHVDKHLTNVAIDYKPVGMIAGMVAPTVSVQKQSDFFPVWNQGDILRVETTTRARGTEAHKITLGVSSDTYYAENYALKMDLTLEDRVNMDAALARKLREGRAMTIIDKLNLDWENRLASQITSTSNVGSSTAVASAWTDYTAGNSTPWEMITTGIDVVQDTTGIRPNSILMGGQCWRNLRRHDDLIDLVHGTSGTGSPRTLAKAQAAALFEVDRFLVSDTYRNTADEGQTAVLSPVWGDHLLIYYAPSAPSVNDASFMYSFRWNAPGLPSMTVERHPFDPKIKSEEIEVGYYQDEVITSSALSYLITNVTSST